MTDQSTTDQTATDQSTTTRGSAGSAAPTEVAERWLQSVAAADGEALRGMYEVAAALHIDEGVALGPERIVERVLGFSAPAPDAASVDVGRNGMVSLTWPDADGGPHAAIRMRVRRGLIVEQWLGEQRSTKGGLASVPLTMSTSGDVSAEDHDLVWDMVDALIGVRDEPALHADVRLRQRGTAGRQNPTELRVMIEFAGGSVRATANAADARSAAQVVERRLKQALRQRSERRHDSRGGQTIRVEAEPSRRGVAERPPAEREIVRHKSVSPGPSTLEEATFDLTSMGYDFFLYVDIASNNDALVARRDDGSFEELIDPPQSTIAAARGRLDAGHEPFVFYRDAETRRGNVLYRRFDGHYGLLVPADEPG